MTKDLTRGTPWKLILQFALPIMAGNLLQQLYNTADTIIVGNFNGQQALSAVAIPIFAVYFPANGMCQGVGEGFHATFFALLALGLRVIFAYALHNTSLFGYTAIWWSQAMAWTVTLLVCYVHVFRGKWKNKSLI